MSASPEPRAVLFAMSDLTVAHAFARILEARGHVAIVSDDLIHALEAGPYDVVVADGSTRFEGLLDLEMLIRLGDSRRPAVVAIDPDDRFMEGVRPDVALERPLLPEPFVEVIESIDSLDPEALHRAERRFELDAVDGAAEDAARELIAWCTLAEVAPPTRARIGSAVAEITQNAVDHGAGSITVVARLDHRELRVEVTDDGPGFDAVDALTHAGATSAHGLGRARSMSEELLVESAPDRGTTVYLRFGVTSIELDQADQIDLTDLDYFAPATAKELLATLEEDADAPIVLSPALAVVVGRLLLGPDPRRVLQSALRA